MHFFAKEIDAMNQQEIQSLFSCHERFLEIFCHYAFIEQLKLTPSSIKLLAKHKLSRMISECN